MPSNEGYVYLGESFVGRVLKDDKNHYYCFIRGCNGKGIERLNSLTRHIKSHYSEKNGYICRQNPTNKEDRDGKILVKGAIEVPRDSSPTTITKRSGDPVQDEQQKQKKRKTGKRMSNENVNKECHQSISHNPDLHEFDNLEGCAQESTPNSMTGIDFTLDIESNELVVTPESPCYQQSLEPEEFPCHAKQFNLEEYGLELYRNKVFYCSICERLLLKEEACAHWCNQHSAGSLLLQTNTKNTLARLLKEHIDLLETIHGLSQTRDQFISSLPLPHLRPPLEKFKLLSGFSCPDPDCIVIHACWETMRAHIRDKHRSHEKTKISVDCQKIWYTAIANSTNCIAVNKSLQVNRQIHSGLLSLKLLNTPWLSSQSGNDSALGEIDQYHREVSGFLSTLGYTNRVDKIPISTILESTQLSFFPTTFLHKLRKLCFDYLEFTQHAIEMSVIFSPDLLPAREESKKLVKDKLRNLTPRAVSQYSLTLCRFVAFGLGFLRKADIFAALKVSITREQQEALEILNKEIFHYSYDVPNDHLENEICLELDEEFVNDFEEEESDDHVDVQDENTDTDNIADLSTPHLSVSSRDGTEIPRLPLSLQSVHRYILACFQLEALAEETTSFSIIPSYVIFKSFGPDGKFKSSVKQTPFNARLKYIGKAAFLHDRIDRASQNKGSHSVNGNMQPDGTSGLLRLSHDRVVTTPYTWLSHVQSRLTSYAYNANKLAIISWDTDSEEHVLTYEDHRISMTTFGDFISALHQEVDMKLNKLLLGIPIEDLLHSFEKYNDDLQEESESYNYLSDSPNLKEHIGRLYHHMCQDNRYCSSTNGTAELKINKVQEYLKICEDFMLHLFVAIYFTSGMPPRATELLASLCRNTMARMRDLFIIGNEMVMRSAYMKTNNIAETTGRTLRIISPRIAKAVDVYLKYIAPFSFFLVQEHFPSLHVRSLENGSDPRNHPCFTHLFAVNGSIISQHSVYRYFQARTQQAFGFPLGISDARHIMIAIGRRYIPPASFSNPSCELQANHSVKIAQRHYAVARYLPKGIWEDEAQQFFYTSKFWQFLWKQREFEEIPQSSQTGIAVELYRILSQNKETIHLDPEDDRRARAPWINQNLGNSSGKNAYELLAKMFP